MTLSDLVDEATAAAFARFVQGCFASSHFVNEAGVSRAITVEAAHISLSTGQVAITDLEWPAEFLRESDAVAVTVAPGEYPVDSATLLVPMIGTDGLEELQPMVTLIRLTFEASPVESWSPAPGPNGNGFYVPISRGLISIWDWDAREFLTSIQGEGLGVNGGIGQVRAAPFTSGNSIEILRHHGREILFAKSGYGADDYFVWFGRTASGSVAQVAIDLRVLGWASGTFESAMRDET